MNRRMTILISGIITFVATLIISGISIDDWSGITKWAFCAILGSEAIFFGGLLFAEDYAKKSEELISRVALYVLLSLYAVINISAAITFMVFFKEDGTSFVNTEVVINAVFAIAVIVSLTVSRSVLKSNQGTMANVAKVEAMIERLNKLAVSDKCVAYSATLRKLSEELRFTDISSQVPEDAEIAKAIAAIELEVSNGGETSEQTIKDTLINLNSLIAQRSVTVSTAKRGGI